MASSKSSSERPLSRRFLSLPNPLSSRPLSSLSPNAHNQNHNSANGSEKARQHADGAGGRSRSLREEPVLHKRKSTLNRISTLFTSRPSLILNLADPVPPSPPSQNHRLHRKSAAPAPSDDPGSAPHTQQQQQGSSIRPVEDAPPGLGIRTSATLPNIGSSTVSDGFAQDSSGAPHGHGLVSSQTMPVSSSGSGSADAPSPRESEGSDPRASSYLGKIRSSSAQPSQSGRSTPQSGKLQRHASPSPEPRGRSTSAQPPSNRVPPTDTSRASSPAPASGAGGKLRRLLHKSRSNSIDMKSSSYAWVISPEGNADYNTSFVVNGDKVPELWNESGDVLVYLYPKSSSRGPAFKVPMVAVTESRTFHVLMQAEMESSPTSSRSTFRNFDGRESLSVNDATRILSPPPPEAGLESYGEQRLYIPAFRTEGELGVQEQVSQTDMDRLLAIRNLFAFLTGQPLVGTKTHPTLFAAFMQVADLLKEFEYCSYDGTTFGEAVHVSMGFYLNQMGLADVRQSREKTIEALVLSEHMRSWELYNEAFAHAVGKYSALVDLKSPLFEQVSVSTRRRLGRAHLDMLNRQNSVNTRLEQFEFPSLFAGVANSATVYKMVRFKQWRVAFMRMRQFVLGYYKSAFGNWPPKASSKKNTFSESGLNRQVLKILYSDLCALYDLLVDRESLTPRVIDQQNDDGTADETMMSGLRKMLGEFDSSSPPVLPPIPFDIPKIPSPTAIMENYHKLSVKEQQRFDRKIKENELILLLHKSYNFDTDKLKIPFLNEFKLFDLKESKGKNSVELTDQRIGCWLFLYVVIQCLPMLTVDAPELQFTEGVEYFLCQPPHGNPPWMEEAGEVRKMWYEVSGGAGIVELSADVVLFSVEATYHRSHCWLAAKQWEAAGPDAAPPPEEDDMSPLQPPQNMFQDFDLGLGSPQSPNRPASSGNLSPRPASPGYPTPRSRTGSPGRGHPYRSSIAIGLEPLPMPGGMPGDRTSRAFSAQHNSPISRPVSSAGLPRSSSANNLRGMAQAGSGKSRVPESPLGASGSTFDDILKGMDKKKSSKKRFF